MYIHLLFWHKTYPAVFSLHLCHFFCTNISQMFELLSYATSLSFIFIFCLFIHDGGACSIQLSSEVNTGIKPRLFHRKFLEKFYYWLILADTVSLCFEITLPGKRSTVFHCIIDDPAIVWQYHYFKSVYGY